MFLSDPLQRQYGRKKVIGRMTEPTYRRGVDSNRKEYQAYFLGAGGKWVRCVGLTTLPSSYADRLEMWEPQPSRTLRVCPSL
jgi:hypothetical protein